MRSQLDIEKALESSDEERDNETLEVLKRVRPNNDPHLMLSNMRKFYNNFQIANQTYYMSKRNQGVKMQRALTSQKLNNYIRAPS